MKSRPLVYGMGLINPRPRKIKEKIDEIFEQYALCPNGNHFGTYGKSNYYLGGIDEQELIRSIVDNSPPAQKDFYFMDVGAGAFVWLDSLKVFLNKKFPESDKTFHIIGVSAEGGQKKVQKGDLSSRMSVKQERENHCVLYKIGGFKLETIEWELDFMELDLRNKVDFIISNFTFRHLVDPVGTFTQVYELLKPESGVMITDGFDFNRVKEDGEYIYPDSANQNMMHLLCQMGVKFLQFGCFDMRSLNHFLVKKGEEIDTLPLSYAGLEYIGDIQNRLPYGIVLKDKSGQRIAGSYPEYSGDEEIYEWVKNEGFLCGGTQFNGPVRFDISYELYQLLFVHFFQDLAKQKQVEVVESLEPSLDNISTLIFNYMFDCGFVVKNRVLNMLEPIGESENIISSTILEYLGEEGLPLVGSLEQAALYEE